MRIIGIDLAWGEKKPDGIAAVEVNSRFSPVLFSTASVQGDMALLANVQELVGRGPSLLAIDGPIICPNRSGMRPVDRLTHVLFSRQHAGCHPANATKCPRPGRIARKLQAFGFSPAFALDRPRQQREIDGRPLRRQIEVYPHPAMLRLFRLDRIFKYKKGPAMARREELTRLQVLLFHLLPRLDPPVKLGEEAERLFRTDPRSLRGGSHKEHEDRLDAVICALVGLYHWWHGGRRSQILGDLKTGYIVLPRVKEAHP